MLIASCHCQAVRIAVPRAPSDLNECHCSICRRYAARWAYYAPSEVDFLSGEGTTDAYIWGDRMLAFHRCATCGCLTHWSPLGEGEGRMGVNGRLFEPDEIAASLVRVTAGPA